MNLDIRALIVIVIGFLALALAAEPALNAWNNFVDKFVAKYGEPRGEMQIAMDEKKEEADKASADIDSRIAEIDRKLAAADAEICNTARAQREQGLKMGAGPAYLKTQDRIIAQYCH